MNMLNSEKPISCKCPDNSCYYNLREECLIIPEFEWVGMQEFEGECEFGHRAHIHEDVPAFRCLSKKVSMGSLDGYYCKCGALHWQSDPLFKEHLNMNIKPAGVKR